MASSVIIGLSSLAATYVFLRILLSYTHHDREPTAVATEIPFLSPLFGMAKKGKFYTDLRDKYNLPIYTLRLPGSRIYVVNSTNLITAIQRQPRVLDFAPIEAKAAINVMGATMAGKEILNQEREGVGKHAYAIEFDKAIHPAVTPGPKLDAMNRLSVQKVAEFLENTASSQSQTLNLYGWVREHISWATTEAVYGPQNPFRDSEILDAFGKFEPGIVILLLQLLPSILAKESIQAREKIVKAFIAYFDAGGHKKGSALVRARFQHSVDYNVSTEDIARFELGGAVAILTNTIPSAFWTLWHIISDAAALEECRNELYRVCKIQDDTVTIDITEVKLSCPMLLSTLQEVLRIHGTGTSVRIVQEDHLLDGKYLLKKGGTLMIPGPVQHTANSVYGESVNEFNHKRFVRTNGKRLNPVGFRGFGGGSTLCPGRHFASTEIIAFVALMVLRFNVKPKGGVWVRPTTHKAGMQATVPPPDADLEVEITLREGELEGKRWNVILTGSDKAVPIVAEDVDQN
ncbi:cytochrome P450 [Cucurbitaria berberidis CBS 394.84]|uniref:Cytochrome P450 n=1 Tax=Cucurbitaria berberidis CBS 394.84 TaxID=1168544 RepID=A0A9P4LCT4_9PLEO|nr:cytochrome P450 [Cucurbitaria berberidis CBS 394.84]KAF1849697.1 cytochrome P450 [Cucurbitaria berberidis CBS 394.84]